MQFQSTCVYCTLLYSSKVSTLVFIGDWKHGNRVHDRAIRNKMKKEFFSGKSLDEVFALIFKHTNIFSIFGLKKHVSSINIPISNHIATVKTYLKLNIHVIPKQIMPYNSPNKSFFIHPYYTTTGFSITSIEYMH